MKIAKRLLEPIDAAWLAAFRVLYGLALAISMERFLAHGWVEELLVRPRFKFHYAGFAWVPVLPSGPMHALFWILMGLALAVAAGAAFRVTAPLFAAGLTYIQLVDVSTYLNHYYLAALLAWLLAASPANRMWSVDAWLRKRAREDVARAWLWVFRVQIGLVYVYAGLAKLQPDWLLHGQPLRIWLGARTDLPILGRIFAWGGVPLMMSWAGFLFDLTIVGWLSWRRTRPYAYAVLLTFHTLTRLLFDIGMFPIIMSIAALVFFSPSWPRRFVRRPASPPISIAPARWHRYALAFGALYCAAQLLLPLRSRLYGGDVLWHEQGMRFSWRVMVRAKGGAVTFLVKDKTTGAITHVSPRRYLAPFQENEMVGQPDLVLQLAHAIRDDHGGDVEVYADAIASLDGRRAQRFIDPNVDLARVDDTLAPAAWILPAPTDPPPHTRPVL
ncbi:MAG: HTTM domain-containing protein [Labilithrix sp.]|nr:HTTM domain-containing protein [Labilithrix sp.]MCW5811125.1 HTTM domain-containing protein [Labilithrix sp.]